MFDKEVIKKREKTLEEARQYLKSEFVGIDEIIDKFINSVRIWFVLPELQSRPLIVNLWGITGVGKTDLVRKFVNFIEFSDRFVEIQMDSREGNASVQDYLEMVIDNGDKEGILLLDEMQRFRSVSEDGKESNSNKYQDIWMLLSDGTFQSDSKIKHDLIRLILEDDYWSERDDEDDEEDAVEGEVPSNKPKKPKKLKYKTSYWEASRMKKMLKLEEAINEIMTWDKEKKVNVIKDKLASKETFEGKKYTRLLIVVSGNLDEAFTMSSDVQDADRDADVYHEFSKSIDVVEIKAALRHRFKPEQIARLGNIHLIYPIPNREAYMRIIQQKISNIVDNIKEKHKINIKIDQSVFDVIYDNGVFPTQGVRPLLSTISAILENSLPTFLFEHLDSESKKPVKLFHKDGFILSTINGKEIKYEIPTVLDDIKDKQTEDERVKVAVHEAGHAVLYALLHGVAPTQVVVTTTNHDTGGFIGTHHYSGSREQYERDIQVVLGGRIAEQMVFGSDKMTNGCSADYLYATQRAAAMVRNTGMYNTIGYYIGENNTRSDRELQDIKSTDKKVIEILEKQYKNAEVLLSKNQDMFLKVVDTLLERTSLRPEEFKEVVAEFCEVEVVSAKDSIQNNFKDKLGEFKKNLNK